MKERFESVKEWVKNHKRRAAGIVVVFLLVIGAGIGGVVGVNSVNAERAAENKAGEVKTAKTVKKETEKEIEEKTDQKDQEKETEKKEEADSAKETDNQAENAETPGSGSESMPSRSASTPSGSASTPSGSASTPSGSTSTVSNQASGGSGGQATTTGSKQPVHTHSYSIPVYGTEQKWVVDQAAWTETVNEPIYETVERCICNGCGTDITTDPGTHMKENMMAGNYSCGAWHAEWSQIQTGSNTYTITHPEQGHWESYSVVTGYQCSCGAVQ